MRTPPPPLPTLFPYTTLFRSTNQIAPYYRAPHVLFGFPTRYVARPLTNHVQKLDPVPLRKLLLAARSEEHTSELQSPCNLVCRLLLEKKNKDHTLRPVETNAR